MAYAGARFALALIRGLKGEPNVIECAYVKSNVTDAPYFSTPLVLGKQGVERNLGIPGNISPIEQELVQKAVVAIKKSAELGEAYALK